MARSMLSLESQHCVTIRMNGRRPTRLEAIELLKESNVHKMAGELYGVRQAPDAPSSVVERYIRDIALIG